MIEARHFENQERPPDPGTVREQWGRIIALLPQLDSVDLIEPSLTLGRSEQCDIIIYKSKFPPEHLLLISKEHFRIARDPEDVYITYITDLSKNGTYVNGRVIGRNKTIVLQNNDVVAVGNMLQVYIFKSMKYSVDDNYLPSSLRQRYEPSLLLGKGACGEVRLAYAKLSCRKYAIKKILKARNTPSQIENINHPSRIQAEPLVVNMEEIVETDDTVFIVLEYIEGGELSARISLLNLLTESNAKFLFYQIVLAVQYLHSQGVTHRDLKPCNVLLTTDHPQTLIKVTDFGLSKLSEGCDMKTVCGTLFYMAPEVLNPAISEYDRQVDVWSLGVILFHMLSKELPFRAMDKCTLRRLIVTGKYNMRGLPWYEVSPAAKDLIKRMLTIDPKRRITVDGILDHPWIKKDNLMIYRVQQLLNTPK
ncbi:serine/threonine-protein kinase Chk2-like isoform X2 [Anoplophora glabripennis]|uniref:serine/threonine-protein kinase Chk2-like isoform X2 n=1 Tax=Anoplophora glabripennis TaxID=217634 RepID=UPI000874286E|nr:serine/threonine-protein kinase Chk2-like isoform X2 [Anoplophora glabripennis]